MAENLQYLYVDLNSRDRGVFIVEPGVPDALRQDILGLFGAHVGVSLLHRLIDARDLASVLVDVLDLELNLAAIDIVRLVALLEE